MDEKEILMERIERKIFFGSLVYRKHSILKRSLHNMLLFTGLILTIYPGVESIVSDNYQVFGVKATTFIVFLLGCFCLVCGYFVVVFHNAREVRKNPKLKTFYINDFKIDYEGFRKWQRQELTRILTKSGFESKSEFELLISQLESWMKKEKSSLVLFTPIFTAMFIPFWSVIITDFFEHSNPTLWEKELFFTATVILTAIVCYTVKMLNDIWNLLVSQYSRVHRLKEMIEDVWLTHKKYKQ